MDKPDYELNWIKYHPRILSYVTRMTFLPLEEAEDLTQEIFLKILLAWNRRDGLVQPGSSWYFTIARNHIIDQFRKQRHRSPVLPLESLLHQLESRYPGPEEALLEKNLSAQVEAYLATLPFKDREISFLKFSEGWPDRAIAHHLKTPAGTVKYRIHRIRQGLKRYLEDSHEV